MRPPSTPLPDPDPHARPTTTPWPAPGDPLLHRPPAATDERLARLAARRAGTTAPGGSTTTPRPAGGSTSGGRRPHPAGNARASALALSLATTVGLAAYLQHLDTVAAEGIATIGSTSTTATTATENVDSPATTATDSIASGLADGTYTGDTDSNKWGPVQVQITVTDGSITSIDVVQFPDDDRKSVQINQRALPTLIESALQSQSADVDTVSGATYTSDSYRVSLQSAIDAARSAAAAG